MQGACDSRPLRSAGCFAGQDFFLTQWVPWKRTSCTIELVVGKPRHKRRRPALRGKERHAVESLKRNDNKEMCECQSTMQLSQVGANGAIENAVQRVQRSGRSNRTGCGVKHQGEAHPITNFHVFEQGVTSENVLENVGDFLNGGVWKSGIVCANLVHGVLSCCACKWINFFTLRYVTWYYHLEGHCRYIQQSNSTCFFLHCCWKS